MTFMNNNQFGPQSDLLASLLSLGAPTNPMVANAPAPALQTMPLQAVPGTVAAPATPGSWWDGMVGTPQAPGWGGLALGAAQGLGSAYLGMQQYGLAKDMFKQNKRQFEMNFAAQRKSTNTALEDRQRARVASNPGAYESVGSYMDRNGI